MKMYFRSLRGENVSETSILSEYRPTKYLPKFMFTQKPAMKI